MSFNRATLARIAGETKVFEEVSGIYKYILACVADGALTGEDGVEATNILMPRLYSLAHGKE